MRAKHLQSRDQPLQPAELQSRHVQPAALTAGYLVPDAQAVVRIDGSRAEVSSGAWSACFEGDVAADVAAVATGRVSARLMALAHANQAAAVLASWSKMAWLPLTALDAVRLDGFDTLFVELVGICNERCVHCYAESSPTVTAALDRATCEAIIDDGLALGFRRIQFTGGDPLLCSFLPDLLERAAGYDTREIYTNGLALGEELLAKLAPHRPSFAFSYYSHDAAIHDGITRTPGSQRRTRNAIARAIALGAPVRCAMVVLPENVDTVDATFEDLKSLGVATISAASSMSAGRGSLFGWRPHAASPQPGGHRAPTATTEGKLAVTYEGKVVPCIFNRSRVLGSVDATHRLRDVMQALAVQPGPPASPDKLSCSSCRTTDYALSTMERA
jgi:MoaA/NifB/PqqE/SkfB family radical SAM enzyme